MKKSDQLQEIRRRLDGLEVWQQTISSRPGTPREIVDDLRREVREAARAEVARQIDDWRKREAAEWVEGTGDAAEPLGLLRDTDLPLCKCYDGAPGCLGPPCVEVEPSRPNEDMGPAQKAVDALAEKVVDSLADLVDLVGHLETRRFSRVVAEGIEPNGPTPAEAKPEPVQQWCRFPEMTPGGDCWCVVVLDGDDKALIAAWSACTSDWLSMSNSRPVRWWLPIDLPSLPPLPTSVQGEDVLFK